MKAPRVKAPVPEPASPLRHSFSPGCHYENMKGTYEVLSIEGNTMRIRWENGEESETDLELQDRILSRFEREVRARKAGAGPRQDDEDEPRLVTHSRGLAAADFSPELYKTTWRARTGGIGGLVAQELKVPELCFGFWVPFREPVILWADINQGVTSASQVQAGFLCRLDDAQTYYGFFVRRSDEADGKGPWHRFLEWLSAPGREEWLRCTAAGIGLRILESQGSPSPSAFIQSSGTQWERVEDGRRTEVPSLSALLQAEAPEPGAVLECVAVMAKDRAVGRGRRIGRDMAQLFEVLLPVYRACLGLPEEPQPSSPTRKRRAD